MLQIWVSGEPYPGTQLVYIHEDEEAFAEPIGLDGVEAALNFVKERFPAGWDVENGKVVAAGDTEAESDNVMEIALRAIAFGDTARLREWLAKHDPEAYYPNADALDLCIHVARQALVE